MERLSIWQRHLTKAVLAGLFLLGTLLLVIRPWLWPPLTPITDGIGIACYTAIVIGFTIDLLFRQELARDVFQATVGYLLPKELRPHMRWIYEQNLICTNDVITLEVIDGPDDHLRIYVTRTQTLENKSNKVRTDTPALAIDEWNVPGHPSQILTFTCSNGNDSWPNGQPLEFESQPHSVGVAAKEFRIPPDGHLHIRSVFEEWKSKTDDFLYHYKYPTTKTQVTVKTPDYLESEVRFATIGTEATRVNDTWILEAATLPSQYVRVWWWPKSNN